MRPAGPFDVWVRWRYQHIARANAAINLARPCSGAEFFEIRTEAHVCGVRRRTASQIALVASRDRFLFFWVGANVGLTSKTNSPGIQGATRGRASSTSRAQYAAVGTGLPMPNQARPGNALKTVISHWLPGVAFPSQLDLPRLSSPVASKHSREPDNTFLADI